MNSSLDQLLSSTVAGGTIPGIVGLAANASGVTYSGAYGHTGPAADKPLRLDSVFRIASMTKAVTSAAVMQLVEQGRLGLDQPMREIAPELGQAKVLLGFEAGKPQTRAPKRDITLRHLLTHTSGYSYDLFNTNVARYMEHAQLPSITTCRFGSLSAPLVFDPGERWEYGIGIDWVGRIVEIVSGEPLETYLQKNLLGPLGMRDTSFLLRPDMQERLVAATSRTPDGKVIAIEFEFPSDADFHMGGGGLYSTGPDYLRFTRMLLGGGNLDGVRVLAPETVNLMGQNAIGNIEVPAITSDNPAMALPIEFFPGQIKRWGLSFLLNTEDVAGGRAAGSLAWAGVHNTFFWIDPTRQLTAVLMMQLLPANDPHVLEALGRFEQTLYANL